MKNISILFALVLSAHVCVACSCGSKPTVAEAVANSELIFAGRLTKMEVVRRSVGLIDGKEFYQELIICEFSSVDAFKGSIDVKEKVNVATSVAYSGCRFEFEIGTAYLVYAYTKDGELWTGRCDRTRSIITFPPGSDDESKMDDARKTEIPELKKILGIR